MGQRERLGAIAGVFALGGALVGACGSTTTSSGPAPSVTSAPVTTAASNPRPSTTVGATPVPTGQAAFCTQLVTTDQRLTAAIPTASASPGGVAVLSPGYEALAGAAPPAVRSSVSDLAGLVKAVSTATVTPAAMPRALAALVKGAGPDEEAIGTWAGQHCLPG